jgi:signal transduction histidine kinase
LAQEKPNSRPPAYPAAIVADPRRLESVRATGLLDTPPEEVFDAQTRIAARLMGAPATFISLVDADRDFYKSCFGFSEPLSITRELHGRTFCHYALVSEGPLVIHDTLAEPAFREVPTVVSLGVRAYLGVPMRTRDGFAVGSFCAIDFAPRAWSAEDVELLTTLAAAAMREVELRIALRESDRRERDSAFVAEMSLRVNQSAALGETLQDCAGAMNHHFGALQTRIWTVEGTAGAFALQGCAGAAAPDVPDDLVPGGDGLLLRIAESRQPLVLDAWPAGTRGHDSLPASGLAGCPLTIDESLVGVMAVWASEPFSGQSLRTMVTIANVVANGIDRKRIHDAIVREGRQKDVFVATLAHELKQPLSALVPALSLLRMRTADPEAQRVRHLMERQVRHLQQLVDELLDTAAVAQGKVTLRRERADLRAPIVDAADQFQASIVRRGQTLTLSLTEDPAWVLIDVRRMHQVFSNLLANAVKYTGDGGHIRVTLTVADSVASVAVCDNGQGIDASALPHVFELFVQEANETRQGLGIGLAVVRRVVGLHGGSVDARSGGPGRGSEFVVTLPLVAEQS